MILPLYYPERVIQELSEEQKEAIVNSRDFRSFFDRAVRIVEKAICDVDVAFPYSGDGLDNMYVLFLKNSSRFFRKTIPDCYFLHSILITIHRTARS